MELAVRRPHAILEERSRVLKARKIARLVSSARPLAGARLLDIGSGGGMIARSLAEEVGPAGRVVGVDVVDQRTVREGFEFVRVDGTALPFADGAFDVVLSNHVIEHVGERADQLHHLREVRRVLAPAGVCYLAVPNKRILVEPHFRLPFLSWLPQRLADAWVRRSGKGAFYDCRLPTRRGLRRLFREAGFEARELTVEAARVTAEVEGGALARVPGGVLRALLPLTPTMVYLLRSR